MNLLNLLSLLLALVGPVVVLVLVLVRATGRARLLGALGSGALIVTSLLQGLLTRMLPTILRTFELPSRSVGLLLLPGQLLGLAGLILLGLAVGARDRPAAVPGPYQR